MSDADEPQAGAAVSVNVAESSSLLGSDAENEKAAAQAKSRRRWTQLLWLCTLSSTAMWLISGNLIPQVINGRTYTARDSLLDLLLADGLRLILTVWLLIVSLLRNKARRDAVSWYTLNMTVIMMICIFSKLWAYRGWWRQEVLYPSSPASSPRFDPSLLQHCHLWWLSTLTMIVTITSVFLSWLALMAIDRIDHPPKSRLRWAGLKKILRPYFLPTGIVNKIIVTLTLLVVVGAKFSNIVAPLMMGRAVEKLSSNPPTFPSTEIILFGVFSLLPTLLDQLQEVLSAWVWKVAFVEVAEQTFRHVHSLSLEWHLKKRMGNVIRAMDRGLNAAESLVGWLVLYLGPAFAAAAATFLLFVIHFDQPVVAAVMCFFLAFYCWLTYVLTMWKKKFNESMNKHDNEMHEKATDALINFETVKYFTAEDYEAKNYVTSVKQFQTFSYTATATTAVLNLSQQSVIQGCTVAALLLTANAVMDFSPVTPAATSYNGTTTGGSSSIIASGQSTSGAFVAVNLYLVQLFAPLAYLGSLYGWIIQSAVNMQNLSDLLSETPDIKDKPDAKELKLMPSPTSPVKGGGKPSGLSIEFRNVCFKYPAQAPGQGVKDVSFTVAPGTTTAIVGHTGSCKTTISRLLFRFYDLQSGGIFINGQNIADVTQTSLRQAIGMVPQDTVMFNDTIRHNIAYGKRDATQEELDRVAHSAQIYEFIGRLEEKWDTVVGERGLKLSGGEKQRVAIARCLLKNPPIVVLDEATSALDNKTEKEIQTALNVLAGRTTLIIAHRLTTVQNADQIIVMKEGRIVERGTHEALLAAAGEYSEMWYAQKRDLPAAATPPPEGEQGEGDDDAPAATEAKASALKSPTSPKAATTTTTAAAAAKPSGFVHPDLEPEEDDD